MNDNNETNRSSNDFDQSGDNLDKLVGKWLAPLNADVPPPPQDVINRANQIAGNAFVNERNFGGTGDNVDSSKTESASPQVRQKDTRGKTMLMKVLITAGTLAASFLMFFSATSSVGGDTTLGNVLKETLKAKSLQLKLIKSDDANEAPATSEVLVHGESQRLRLQQSPMKYCITRGARLWRIDEEANTVGEEMNPWVGDEAVDLLAMLDVPKEQAAKLRKSVSNKVVTRDGRKCNVFEVAGKAGQGLLVEALVDSKTGLLYSIECWPRGRREGAPKAELQMVARDLPLDEEKFKVAESLTEDGRIGKIVDSQGIVTLRPMMRNRWTPVGTHMLIKPGDWLRTDVRGANASTVALTSNVKLIAGPGSLVELQGPHRLKIHRGEINVKTAGDANNKLELIGPKDEALAVASSGHYRLDRKGEIKTVTLKPKWLAGYEGSSSDGSIGSLIAKVDGRDVPLTVGFHKVKVEIRDQIARTTIEESFVNRTDSRLEGVFYFPLPQDASISGFGMWINGELVEADVVEKQRAREIYETILRERRDPGLLEWTGGNIFKARVFPIEPHSEKRIKIVYTQVLPLRGNKYRYSYGLRSELLRKTPVRELSLDVQVHSAIPLKSVKSPTHDCRSQLTTNSAKLEFNAQEYSPKRDFEVVCEVDSKQSDIVVIPHRRGDDGYLLVQLSPPMGEGILQREMLGDGDPLELLLVCDTSGSMDSIKREQQQQFLAAVLSSLGEDDRFNVAFCDVNTSWLHARPTAPTDDAVSEARRWIDERVSLGWTNLDRMAESVLTKSKKNSHVIYIGDGIVTAGDADAQAFANRLQSLATDGKGTFHSVSVGASYESVVLKSLAKIGGGSMREISGEQTPQKVATELLSEITSPGLRDLKVEFNGVQVAAVYPETLPNLSAGTQQILVGRYLPQGSDQSGEIVVTGKLGTETVRYASRVSFADAEAGNSFIPRLWARAHLDHLLEQGSSQSIRDEIISMSEEFHIITPYTSLLVLETDEDRERFGVKRRFLMRDGERFFADGRDASTYELLQQQVRRAGDWRIGLRRRILLQLSQLGRNANVFNRPEAYAYADSTLRQRNVLQKLRNVQGIERYSWMEGQDLGLMGGMGGFGGGGGYGGGGYGGGVDYPTSGVSNQFSRSFSAVVDGGLAWDFDSDEAFGELLDDDIAGEELGGEWADGLSANESFASGYGFDASGRIASSYSSNLSLRTVVAQDQELVLGKRLEALGGRGRIQLYAASGGFFYQGRGEGYYPPNDDRYIQWFSYLFPQLATVPSAREEIESNWPQQVREISQSLVQKIDSGDGGIEIKRKAQNFHSVWQRKTSETSNYDLYSSKAWVSFLESTGANVQVQWCDEKERGIYSRPFQLGRTRKSHARDISEHEPGVRPYASRALHETYSSYEVEVGEALGNRIALVLTYKPSRQRIEVLIDTEKNVVLEWRNGWDAEKRTTIKYSDHVQIAGVWWPQKIENYDSKQQLVATTAQTVEALSQEQFAARLTMHKPDRNKVIVVAMPMPTVSKAEAEVANGTADFQHRLALLLRSSRTQQWDDVLAHMKEMEQFQPKPGMKKWVKPAVLLAARKFEDARQHFLAQADELIANESTDELAIANYIRQQVQQVSDQRENLRLLDRLKPVYDRRPETDGAKWAWMTARAQTLRNLTRNTEAMALQKQLAEQQPWDVSAQTTYASDLRTSGDTKAALAWIKQEIERPTPADNKHRYHYELDQLWGWYADTLRAEGRSTEYVAALEGWLKTEPNQQYVFNRYLESLLFDDRVDEANTQAKEWIEAGKKKDELDKPTLDRLTAAIQFALGQGYHHHSNIIDPEWLQPLSETAGYFLDHEHHFEIARQIVTNNRFSRSDEGIQFYKKLASSLVSNAENIPADRIWFFVSWVRNRKHVSQDQWQTVAKTLRERWEAEEDLAKRDQIGRALLSLLASRFPDTDELPFRRRLIARAIEAEAKPEKIASLRKDLFNELVSRDWTEETEAESFELIPQLSGHETKVARSVERIAALHQFVDQMFAKRVAAAKRTLQDTEHPEELTRSEIAEKYKEFNRKAREGLVGRLASRDENDDEALVQWETLERLHLELKLNRNHDQVAAGCWELLGEAPEALELDREEVDPDAAAQLWLKALRVDRAYAIASYLAARRDAKKEDVQRLLKYVDVGTQLDEEHQSIWKQRKFNLLVALDQPDELQRSLSEWIRADKFPSPWKLALGRLHAERGEIDEAIKLFESARRDTQLTSPDLRALGDWYLVADRKDEHRRAKIDVFMLMPEHQIQNWLQQKLAPWTRTDQPLPTEFDEQILFAFQALFQKSDRPGNYVYKLREFYTASREFELMKMVPDAVIGRTPQQIYPFLQTVSSNLLVELRKEATADELLIRLEEVRSKTESAVDLRALDLLEMMIERRSSEVLNQPGPHITKAIAALNRAAKRNWADGEIRQMASLLKNLGKISQRRLNAKRLEVLRELHRNCEPGSDDRLWTAWYLSHSIYYSYGQPNDAIAIMQVAVHEYEQTHPEGWPQQANTPLLGFVDLYESQKRFVDGEKLLTAQMKNPISDGQQDKFDSRCDQLYLTAYQGGGQTSMGRGEAAYRNLHRHLLAKLEPIVEDNRRRRGIDRLMDLFEAANQKKSPSCRNDVREFAFKKLVPLLKKQNNNYHQVVRRVETTVHRLLGARNALAFLLDRYDDWPKRFEYSYQNAWRQLGGSIAQHRHEAQPNLGSLGDRTLKIVLAELRRELETRQSRSNTIYYRHNTYHWRERHGDFLRVAEEVLKQRANSGASVAYIAEYMYRGLHEYNRAIEALLVADKKELLEVGQQLSLVRFLHERSRYAESIPILEPIVRDYPDTMQYRTQLLTAYAQSNRPNQLKEFLAETDKHFRQKGRWNEQNIWQLADNCFNNRLYEESAEYCAELIPLHQRNAPNRGIGNGTLGNYYAKLARSHSQLGNTKEAVDAAAGSIVAWGRTHRQRNDAVQSLKAVLRNAKDLDQYIQQLDEEAESGMDSPIIRKQAGLAFFDRREYRKAATQLKIALELQPNDVETQASLIDCFDKLQDKEGAIKQTLAMLDVDRHNLAMYEQLADRLSDNEAMAERAATSVVEISATEAENHEALAEIRQKQDRWTEAIEHWKHVSELRSLEPNGLLRLAEAQLHEKLMDDARETIKKLRSTEWPSRFQVDRDLQKLEEQLRRNRS